MSPRHRAGGPKLQCAALAIAALATLAGCSGDEPGARNGVRQLTVGHTLADNQILTRAVDAGSMRSLDPSIATDVPAFHVLDDLFEGLTRLDERGEPEPGIASSWETSTDGRTWTFHLREARWSNGDAVRARDFVYAWRRTVDPATASDNA